MVVSGNGPWARRLISAVVEDEESIAAQRARDLARDGRVHDVTVERGRIGGRVVGTGGRDCNVALETRPLPPRVWAGFLETAAGRPEVEAAVAGRDQSVHLQHELAADWGEPLIPRESGVRATCDCGHRDFGTNCQHLKALAYRVAALIDEDPGVVLRWRGIEPLEPGAVPTPRPDDESDDARWTAGPLPAPREARPLPAGAVLMRLGPSGVNAGGLDLAEVLRQAYERFAPPRG